MVVEFADPIKFFQASGVGRDFKHDIETLGLLFDRIGKFADAPGIDIPDGRLVGGQDAVDFFHLRVAGGFIKPGGEDVHDFVLSHNFAPPSFGLRIALDVSMRP